MAVLKSFELEGNKLSFANWISNLSPTCTPFSCMINKEKVNQTQYQWQTDTLAPATADIFEEGSQAEAQPRAVTNIITNFTATLRRAVNVSYTNEAVEAYGRKDELKYQLGKAGKELMRDIEFQNLSKTKARIGTHDTASQYAGFKELVAKVGQSDPDTKAVVHHEIPYWGNEGASFMLKSIFSVTKNLFIVGSKANKIMFHPKHMFIFNDYIAYNEEEPHVHRMFKGMDEKYNAFISQIKDPLGRVYDLIPNRYMPQDEFYIFNENDWTQMVLRAPQRIKLGKTGPSHSIMIETEIGLRHRHPFASGILSLATVNKTGVVTSEKSVLTAYTGDNCDAELEVVNEDGRPVAAFAITWEVSDPSIVELTAIDNVTGADGKAKVALTPLKPGHVTIRAVGDQMVTYPVEIDVVVPVVNAEVDQDGIEINERIAYTVTVLNNDGTNAEDGTTVTLHANSSNVFFLTDPNDALSWVTQKDTVTGFVETHIACEAPGTYQVWASVNGTNSNRHKIYVGSAQLQMEFSQKKDILTKGIDTAVPFEVTINDRDGNPVGQGAKVKWYVDNPNILELGASETLTDATGAAAITITPRAFGSAVLRVHCYGDEITLPIMVDPVRIETVLTPEAIPLTNPTTVGSTVEAFVEDGEGLAIAGVQVEWEVTPSNLVRLSSNTGTTDAQGVASAEVTGLVKGSGTIVSKVNGEVSNSINFTVGMGGYMTFIADPNPTIVGEETFLSGTLTDHKGSFIPDQAITFFVEDKPHPIIQPTVTDAKGEFTQSFIPLVDTEEHIDAICTSLSVSRQVLLTFDTRELSYEVSGHTNVLTFGLGTSGTITVTARDKRGNAVTNSLMEFTAEPANMVQITPQNGGMTNDIGQASVTLTPLAAGTVYLSGKVAGLNSTFTTPGIRIGEASLVVSATPNPRPASGNVVFEATIRDANGALASRARGTIVSVPAAGSGMSGNATTSGALKFTRSLNDRLERDVYAHLTDYPNIRSSTIKLTVV